MSSRSKHLFLPQVITCTLALFASLALVPRTAQAAGTITSTSTVWDSGVWTLTEDVIISERIVVDGGVTLELGKDATLTARKGITVEGSNSLTIRGEGTLIATGDTGAPLFEDGDAIGHAGIGSGGGDCGTIVIEGGIVQATGGSGFAIDPGTGGTVEDLSGAGIGGSGLYGNGGTITINGGTVTATAGNAKDMGSAGIGGGNGGSAHVTINGGTITAKGGPNAAAIGSGNDPQSPSSVSIKGGTIDCNGPIGSSFVREDDAHATVLLEWLDRTCSVTATYAQDDTVTLANSWRKADDATAAILTEADLKAFSGLTTIVPHTDLNVTFNSNGGTHIAEQTVTPGGLVTKPSSPYLAKHTFAGWYSDEALTSPYNFSAPVLADLTLYAKWDADPTTVTITFKANGGSGSMKAQTVVENKQTVLTANRFKRTGFAFTGWNTKMDGSGTSYRDKATLTTKTDLTLYAQWKDGLTVKLVEGEGAPRIAAPNLKKTAATLATDAEKAQVTRIELRSKALKEQDVPADDRKIAEAVAAKQGAKAGVWFDLSLYKKVGDNPEKAIHATKQALSFTVTVPDSIKAAKNSGRTYYLIRMHNGQATLLAQTNATKIAAKTDRFSTYLIAYKDAQQKTPASKSGGKSGTDGSSLPKTGDTLRLPLMLVAALLGAVVTTGGIKWYERQDR